MVSDKDYTTWLIPKAAVSVKGLLIPHSSPLRSVFRSAGINDHPFAALPVQPEFGSKGYNSRSTLRSPLGADDVTERVD